MTKPKSPRPAGPKVKEALIDAMAIFAVVELGFWIAEAYGANIPKGMEAKVLGVLNMILIPTARKLWHERNYG